MYGRPAKWLSNALSTRRPALSQLSTKNGPDPIGRSVCAFPPFVIAVAGNARSLASSPGVAVVTSSIVSPLAVMFDTAASVQRAGVVRTRSRDAAISAAVSAVPSWNFTPFLIVIAIFPPVTTGSSAARCACGIPAGPIR